MDGSSIDQTGGQQKVPMGSTQRGFLTNQNIAGGKMEFSPQGKQDISSPIQKSDTLPQEKQIGGTKPPVSTQSPCKVVVLPTSSNCNGSFDSGRSTFTESHDSVVNASQGLRQVQRLRRKLWLWKVRHPVWGNKFFRQ